MKTIIFILTIITTNIIFGQCQCESNIIQGIKINNCIPSLVAFDNSYQIGLSLNKIDQELSLVLTIRFKNKANTVSSNLLVFSESEEALNLKILDSKKDYVGESEISHTKFQLTEKSIQILSEYKLSYLRFQLSNEDLYRTFEVKKDSDIIINQLKCLK